MDLSIICISVLKYNFEVFIIANHEYNISVGCKYIKIFPIIDIKINTWWIKDLCLKIKAYIYLKGKFRIILIQWDRKLFSNYDTKGSKGRDEKIWLLKSLYLVFKCHWKIKSQVKNLRKNNCKTWIRQRVTKLMNDKIPEFLKIQIHK